MRSLLFILVLLALPFSMVAQNVLPGDVVAFNGKTNMVAPPDTKPQGVIKVRKPVIRPYFKCEYYLTLANVHMVRVPIETPRGTEMDEIPVFDSTIYGSRIERVFPQKEVHFSRQLVDTINYSYSFEDTASVDTMFVEMWIGSNGKVRWKDADTFNVGEMPAPLRAELYRYVMGINDWGVGGGYKEPKKFMRKQRRAGESYYCQMFIIASSKPLTAEQRHTGARYAPIDVPLNAPGDKEEKEIIEGNRKNSGNDSIPRR